MTGGTHRVCLQVYVHHYVSSSKFILGNGAELRGSFTREPLPEPYSLVVDTEDLKEDLIRRALLLTGHPVILSPKLFASCALVCW